MKLKGLSNYISSFRKLLNSIKLHGFNACILICLSIFLSDMLVLKYTDLAIVDSIELSESESEEVEETEFDDFLVGPEIDSKHIKINSFQFNNSNLTIINYHLDVFTPPPEI